MVRANSKMSKLINNRSIILFVDNSDNDFDVGNLQ